MGMPHEGASRVAIFGATSGIAKAVAKLYAERGGQLVLVGRDPIALADAADDLRVRGASKVCFHLADLADIEEAREAVEAALRALDGIDVALVAHGSLPDQQRAQSDAAYAASQIALNLTSPVVICEALAAGFQESKKGTIAVVTSVAGDRGRQSNYVYGAAKGGLQRYLEGLRHRLHASGVHVLDIRPGFVRTPMTAHLPRNGSLWVDADRVARDILAAVSSRRQVLYTPFFWRYILALVRALPRSVFHKTKL